MLPILVLAFNRPEILKKTLDAIIDQEHGPIFLSCDGPRLEFPQEIQMK